MVANTQPESEQGLVHTEPNTKAFIDERDMGQGTLWITEEYLTWKSDVTDEQIQLTYPSITMHAICKDTNSFPFDCIYCMIESSALPSTNQNAALLTNQNEEESSDMAEVRFVPDDKAHLQDIYEAIA